MDSFRDAIHLVINFVQFHAKALLSPRFDRMVQSRLVCDALWASSFAC